MYSSMQKYVEVAVQDQVASGTTTNDQSAALKLEDSSASFVAGNVGDIVYDTTDDRMYTVTAVDSATVLSLAAASTPAGTGLNTGKAYKIYSNTSSSKQLIASDGVVLVENSPTDPINSEVNIQYCGPSGIVIEIKHLSAAAGSEAMRDAFQDTITGSLIQAWPLVKYEWSLPPSLILEIAKV